MSSAISDPRRKICGAMCCESNEEFGCKLSVVEEAEVREKKNYFNT